MKCQNDYQAAAQPHDRNVFIVTLVIGVIAIIIGGIILTLESVSSGIMAGGICYLAITFNGLAVEIRDSVPGVGLLLSMLVLLLGHSLNFALAVASGVVHGLRLNLIEFLNWSLQGDGYPFRAFEKKEKIAWTAR